MSVWIENGYDGYYLWEEQLAPDRWLICLKPLPGTGLDYWLYVLGARWTARKDNICPDTIEAHKLKDEFILLCVMHEMRKKYGGVSDDR